MPNAQRGICACTPKRRAPTCRRKNVVSGRSIKGEDRELCVGGVHRDLIGVRCGERVAVERQHRLPVWCVGSQRRRACARDMVVLAGLVLPAGNLASVASSSGARGVGEQGGRIVGVKPQRQPGAVNATWCCCAATLGSDKSRVCNLSERCRYQRSDCDKRHDPSALWSLCVRLLRLLVQRNCVVHVSSCWPSTGAMVAFEWSAAQGRG